MIWLAVALCLVGVTMCWLSANYEDSREESLALVGMLLVLAGAIVAAAVGW